METKNNLTKDWNELYWSEAQQEIKYYDRMFEKYAEDFNLNTVIDYRKIYVAGPWFKQKDRAIMDLFHKYMKEVYPNAYFPLHEQQITDTPKDSYKNNVDHLDECDVVVAFVSTFDTGTAYELGYAKALNKQIILLCWNEKTFTDHGTNLMLALGADLIYKVIDFMVLSINQVGDVFKDNECTIKVKNDWRNVI